MSARTMHLGMRAGELDGKAYARWWNPRMAPIAHEAIAALAHGARPEETLASWDALPSLLDPDPLHLESGYALCDDGTMRVAIRTELPDVTPAMVAWWFAWHSDEPQRYKLWHPRAHVHASWEDGGAGTGLVGRASIVDEHLGGHLDRYRIAFRDPSDVGLTLPGDDVAIVARVGFARVPLDIGHLVHHVRRVKGGSEMRSRFFIGGRHAGARVPGLSLAVPLAARFKRPREADARALLAHCAEEMAHLGSFLPGLFEASA